MAGYDDSVSYDGPEEFCYGGEEDKQQSTRESAHREPRALVARSSRLVDQIAAANFAPTVQNTTDHAAILHRSSGYDDAIQYQDQECREEFPCHGSIRRPCLTQAAGARIGPTGNADHAAITNRSSTGYDDSIPYEGPETLSYEGAVEIRAPRAECKRQQQATSKRTTATRASIITHNSLPPPPTLPRSPAVQPTTRTSAPRRKEASLISIERRCKGSIGSRENVVVPNSHKEKSHKKRVKDRILEIVASEWKLPFH